MKKVDSIMLEHCEKWSTNTLRSESMESMASAFVAYEFGFYSSGDRTL